MVHGRWSGTSYRVCLYSTTKYGFAIDGCFLSIFYRLVEFDRGLKSSGFKVQGHLGGHLRPIFGNFDRLSSKSVLEADENDSSFVRLRPLLRNFDRSSVLEADGKGSSFVRLRPLWTIFYRSLVRLRPWGGRKKFVLRPPPSSWDDILSVLGPPPSLKRTYLTKSFRPASFTVRRPPPSQDSRPRPATPVTEKRLHKLCYIYFESRKLVFGRHKICISQWQNVHLKVFIKSYWCTKYSWIGLIGW